MPDTKVSFTGETGLQLAGTIRLPETGPGAWAVIAHCFTCTSDYRINRELAAEFSRCGIASLRFDFTGLGDSAGDFADTNFSTMVADIRAAAAFLTDNHFAPALLVGHSFGGTASMFAAQNLPSVKAIATIGSVADPANVLRHFDLNLERIIEHGEAEVLLSGRPFTIRRQFVEDVTGQPWEETIRGLDRALLVCHSPVDRIVGVEHAAAIFTTAMHPKSYLSLDDAGHLFDKPGSAEYAARVICAWSTKYVGT